jgi:hypothetical protein
MFLIDLVIGVPLFIVALIAILTGLSPLLLVTAQPAGLKALGMGLTIGLMLLVIGFLIVVGIVVGVLGHMAHREVALSGRRTIEAIGEGFGLIKRHFSDIALIWLLMLAAGIGWGVLMIPVFLLVLLVAVGVGGVPAALLYLATRSGPAAAIVGVPVGLLTLLAPLVFLGGLYAVFASSVWTLTYREVLAKDVMQRPEPAPSLPPASPSATESGPLA